MGLHLTFVQLKGRGAVHFDALAVEGKDIAQLAAGSLHIQAAGSIGGDEALLGQGHNLCLRHLGYIVHLQFAQLRQGILLHTIVGVAVLVNNDFGIALHGAALQGDDPFTGTVGHRTGYIVGNGDGNLPCTGAPHGRNGNPFAVHIHGPGTVGIHRQYLLRGRLGVKDHIGLAGGNGTGLAQLLLLLAAPQQDSAKDSRNAPQYIGHFHTHKLLID